MVVNEKYNYNSISKIDPTSNSITHMTCTPINNLFQTDISREIVELFPVKVPRNTEKGRPRQAFPRKFLGKEVLSKTGLTTCRITVRVELLY